MARFWNELLPLLCLCISAFAQRQPWPQETGSTALSRMMDQSPLPTKAPSAHDLRMKRDSFGFAGGSVCGYVTEDAHGALECDEGQFCTSFRNYWQCCNSSAISQNAGAFTIGENCAQAWPTIGFDYNHTAQCQGSCTNTAVLCTDSNYPFVATLTSSANSASNLTALFCDTSSYVLAVGFEYIVPSNTTTSVTGETFTFARPSATAEISAPEVTASAGATASNTSIGHRPTAENALSYLTIIIALGHLLV